MGQHVCSGASLQCTFGVAPSALIVLPDKRVMTSSMPAATIMDHKPLVNVSPFGMCSSPANPTVAAATAAAAGVLTPMACVPATAGPWSPGSLTVSVGNVPALNNSSKLMCSYGGVISVVLPGQATVQIP